METTTLMQTTYVLTGSPAHRTHAGWAGVRNAQAYAKQHGEAHVLLPNGTRPALLGRGADSTRRDLPQRDDSFTVTRAPTHTGQHREAALEEHDHARKDFREYPPCRPRHLC